MKKYALVRTIDNDERVIKFFNDRESAVKYGESYVESAIAAGEMNGVVSVEYGDYDQDNKINGSRKIFETWTGAE